MEKRDVSQVRSAFLHRCYFYTKKKKNDQPSLVLSVRWGREDDDEWVF